MRGREYILIRAIIYAYSIVCPTLLTYCLLALIWKADHILLFAPSLEMEKSIFRSTKELVDINEQIYTYNI